MARFAAVFCVLIQTSARLQGKSTQFPNVSKGANGTLQPVQVHSVSNNTSGLASAEAQGIAAMSLGMLAQSCKCTFVAGCSCDAALSFMNCIANACTSGLCNCNGNNHFLHACHNMSAVCPGIALQCSSNKATCAVVERADGRVQSAHPIKSTTLSPVHTGPGADLLPTSRRNMEQKTCWHLIFPLVFSLLGLGFWNQGVKGKRIGALVAATVPALVLVYLLIFTNLVYFFTEKAKVGYWCAILCVWSVLQMLTGFALFGAVSLEDATNR